MPALGRHPGCPPVASVVGVLAVVVADAAADARPRGSRLRNARIRAEPPRLSPSGVRRISPPSTHSHQAGASYAPARSLRRARHARKARMAIGAAMARIPMRRILSRLPARRRHESNLRCVAGGFADGAVDVNGVAGVEIGQWLRRRRHAVARLRAARFACDAPNDVGNNIRQARHVSHPQLRRLHRGRTGGSPRPRPTPARRDQAARKTSPSLTWILVSPGTCPDWTLLAPRRIGERWVVERSPSPSAAGLSTYSSPVMRLISSRSRGCGSAVHLQVPLPQPCAQPSRVGTGETDARSTTGRCE